MKDEGKKRLTEIAMSIIIATLIIFILYLVGVFKLTEKPEEKSIAKKQQVKQATSKPEYSPGTLYISYKNVDIRSGPSTSYDIVGQLKMYETIRGVSEKGWIKCTKEGKIGYIPKSLLKEAGYPLHVKINEFPIGKYGYSIVAGEVINVSEDTFEFVKLEAIYFDGKKNIVNTDFTYACTDDSILDDSILPDGVKPFEFMGMNQSDYKSVSVEVKDYDRVKIAQIPPEQPYDHDLNERYIPALIKKGDKKMDIFSFLISGAIIFGSFVIGVWSIIVGQLSLAIREIAINTRRGNSKSSKYRILGILAYTISIVGIIILLGGLLAGLSSILK